MTHTRINPFADWGFKFLFGREENKDLLLDFIYQLLEPEVRIKSINYIDTELALDAPELKRCAVTVLATDEEENCYLINMQNVEKQDIRQQPLYYISHLINRMGQCDSDWQYGQIKKVYAICLMNFNYERSPALRTDFRLRNAKGTRTLSDFLTIIQLQIPCIRATSLAEYQKSYEFWLYLLDSLSNGMKTKRQLLDEVDGFQRVSEKTKELFRKLIDTVEADLPAEQRRDYELTLANIRTPLKNTEPPSTMKSTRDGKRFDPPQ